MAWFKFGKQDESNALRDAPVQTVEAMRSQAKRRLVGSLVLVLVAVVGFPLLFDTQPRPLLVDVPIEIPDKNKLPPLVAAPAQPPAPAPDAKVDDKSSLQAKEEIVKPGVASSSTSQASTVTTGSNTAPVTTRSASISVSPNEKVIQEQAAQAKAAAEKTAADKVASDQAAAAKAEALRAQALLEGKAAGQSGAVASAATPGERYIVQFGAFADASKAQEVRQRVEKVGLKTYAQVAETSEGKRHRVRVGPFATKAEAEKAAAKIKALDLPAAILTL